ncbi:hypothetical protein DPMN_115664 [Dreissena polymorpha]|uniref:Uncharacterized protein n=1 Tax=Dreissena polymorpha TaxID=45954 RepID=A0A9D4KMD3_DREPO|nr:hypothetical protein DPMN_115664 [Dreissena polymorpha]
MNYPLGFATLGSISTRLTPTTAAYSQTHALTMAPRSPRVHPSVMSCMRSPMSPTCLGPRARRTQRSPPTQVN